VLAALSKRPPHHRSAAFRALLADLGPRLQRLFGTAGRTVLLAASGTGGMEAAALGLARPGEETLVAASGKFGERWEKILRAHGHAPRLVRAEYGKAVPPGALEEELARRAAHAVFLTHSETSTGTLHDLLAQAQAARRHGALVVADVVTSLAVHEFRQDAFGVDAAVAGSQKGLMLSPGLALVGLSERALARLSQDDPPRSPSFYLDLRRAAERAAEADTPFTPAVSLVLALDESLSMIEEVGLEAVWRRHALLAAALRAGATALGFRLFSEAPADSVTALVPPAGAAPERLLQICRERHGMVLAGGQDALKGKLVRVGHMGLAYAPEDARAVTEVLAAALAECGIAARLDEARAAVARVLKETPCESSSPTP
jgi:aspartate aminotransferase-like enzyme